MVDLPTIPYGGIISLGMIIGSLLTKKGTSKFLLYGGLGLGVYNIAANSIKLFNWSEANIPGLNAELLKGLGIKSSNYGTYNTMPYGEF